MLNILCRVKAVPTQGIATGSERLIKSRENYTMAYNIMEYGLGVENIRTGQSKIG